MDRDFKIVIVNRDREFSSDRGPNRIVIVNRDRDREFSSDRGVFFLGRLGRLCWVGWLGWLGTKSTIAS